MKNIQLKLKDSEKTVETFDVTDGELLIIEAQRGINYELFNTLSGMAPQNIITKRIDQDLLIILDESEGGGSPDEIIPDIVIRDYYGEARGDDGSHDATGVLVGLHQNGKYYAYIPESSDPNNAVSVLGDNMAEPQAIGGNEIVSGTFFPWWALYAATTLFILTSNSGDDTNVVTSEEYVIKDSYFNFDIQDTVTVTITNSGKLDLSSESIQTKLKEHNIKLLDLLQKDVDLTITDSDIDKIVGKDNPLLIKANEGDKLLIKATDSNAVKVLDGEKVINDVAYKQYDLDGDKTADLLISGVMPEII